MPRHQSPMPLSSQQAKHLSEAALPAPIRNRLAQSGRVSSSEVKQPPVASPVRR